MDNVEIICRCKSDLNRYMRHFILESSPDVLPKTIKYVADGMGSISYKITIEVEDNETFIDPMGRKWKRVQ